jgi:hypothetical protein
MLVEILVFRRQEEITSFGTDCTGMWRRRSRAYSAMRLPSVPWTRVITGGS